MKAVMVSIKPKFCELIASGKKTVEVRKTRPKLDTPREKIADYLLENGVVVLPCKVGDTVYYPSSSCDKIFEKTIDEILINGKGTYIHFASTYMPLENIGKTVLLTREEAERALKGAKSYGKVDKCE